MNKMIRWGIIGCGDVTEVKSGPAFSKVPGSSLLAVMRRNGEKAKDYAARHGVPKWYDDADRLINDPDVDAVYIATPPDSHEAYAVRTLRAGKPVYVEKPMSLDAAGAQRISDAAKETGVKLSVAHYRRQQPLFLKIKSLLESGAIGKVKLVNLQFYQPAQTDIIARTEVPWRLDPAISGGGLFHDLAPHQLDLMLHFFGKPLTSTGLSFNSNGTSPNDATAGQVLFPDNILFNGAWHFDLPEKRDHCEIIGTAGSLSFSIFDHQPLELRQGCIIEMFEFEKLQHVQQPMIAKVVEYFLGSGPNPCSGEEGVEVMRMIDSIGTMR